MAEEKIENGNSENAEPDKQEEELETEVVDEIDDPDVLKEKLAKVEKANKQLFSRTKQAEGFVKGDEGKWVKKPVEKKEEKKEKPKEEKKPEEIADEKLSDLLDAKLEKRELTNLDISDTLKKDVGDYAKLNGVSVKEALNSPYIQFRKKEAEEADNTEEASLGGGKGKTAKISDIDPSKLDLTTDEGKANLKKWEDKARKELG